MEIKSECNLPEIFDRSNRKQIFLNSIINVGILLFNIYRVIISTMNYKSYINIKTISKITSRKMSELF
jgi:hypothetical protein